jgi:hypothetical protein
MINATIEMGKDHRTVVSGKNIDELLAKIKEFHTMSNFEREHYDSKGTLSKQLRTGWYTKC